MVAGGEVGILCRKGTGFDMNKTFVGKWKIVEMDEYDQDYVDLVEPGFIAFDDRGRGEFMFGVVNGGMMCGHGQSLVHFTWEGSDEGDDVHGDGWAELDEDSAGTLTGCIAFSGGDESEFKASKL